MTKATKSSKEAEAIKKLDKSALLAQERITEAAQKAQKMIDDACATATQALENTSRIPDKRNLDGSFQWDRGDRYRRGSDDRLERLEDKVNGERVQLGSLEIGQAKREEQIIGLLDDVTSIKKDYDQIRAELDTVNKEVTSRMSTLRELILEIKEGQKNELAEIRTEFITKHSEAMSKIQWKIIAAVSSIAFLFILVFISLSLHVFGALP